MAFREGAWDSRDRGLAAELTRGTARWRHRLDYAIRQRTGRPLKDLDRSVRTLLRLGAYQLLFLSRIPASAAVNETVHLAGDRRRRDFVNGVLRALAREGEPPLPPGGVERLAVEWSLPRWLAERWWQQHGPEGAALRAENAARTPALTLRLTASDSSPGQREDYIARCAAMGVAAEAVEFLPDAVRLPDAAPVADLPGYAAGEFVVQDAASQLAGLLGGARPGEQVLDACAAPGGKCAGLAAAVGPGGSVLAVERDAGRIRRLSINLERLRLKQVTVLEADAASLPPEVARQTFDRVFLDAPCSGLGTLARHPEGKWWKSVDGIRACADSQAALLAHLAPRVRPGGSLVYAVCTGEPEETIQPVAVFLATHPEFHTVPAGEVFAALGERGPGDVAAPWVTPNGELDTHGNRVGMDGFFAVHLRRKS